MNCPKCGRDNNDKLKFCQGCGENLQKIREAQMLICPECGEKNEGDVSFCGGCGFSFAAMKAAQARRAADEKMLGFDLSSFGGLAVDANAATGDFDLDALSQTADAFGSQAIATQKKEAIERALSVFEYLEQGNGTYIITALKNKAVLNADIPVGVESIGEGVFEGSNVFSVHLPEGLMQIGSRAFKNCKNLSEINLPSTVILLGDEVFAGCEILEIELPKNLRRVGRDVILDTATDKAAKAKAAAERAEREQRERAAAQKAAAEARAAAEKREKEALEAARIARERKLEEERLAAEERAKQMRDAEIKKAQMDESTAKAYDSEISQLAERDPHAIEWCDQVESLEKRVNATFDSVKSRMLKLASLRKLIIQAKSIRKCHDINAEISRLRYSPKKDEDWANGVFRTLSQIPSSMPDFIKGKDELEALIPEAHKILRKPTTDEFKKCLEAIEKGKFGKNLETYMLLDAKRATLDFDPELYIKDFGARWSAASKARKAEIARIEAEKQAQAEAERLAKEAAEKRAIAEENKRKLMFWAMPLLTIILTIGIDVALGIVIKNLVVAVILIAVVAMAGYTVMWWLFRHFGTPRVSTTNFVINEILCAIGTILLFIPVVRPIGGLIGLLAFLSCFPLFFTDIRSEDTIPDFHAFTAVISLTIATIGFSLAFADTPGAYFLVSSIGVALTTGVPFTMNRVLDARGSTSMELTVLTGITLIVSAIAVGLCTGFTVGDGLLFALQLILLVPQFFVGIVVAQSQLSD